VGAADGELSQSEENLILSAVSAFGMNADQYNRIKSQYARTGNQYYAVLKTDASASNEDIKKQYRKLVAEFHPDKIASKGLPEEFTKFANDKFREIQQAYEAIKQERGFK
jgi:DnaJ like chaperone protein